IIQHAPKEYSVIAHFKKESINVDEGDIVQQGQVIGRCGNSGNSSEQHIHFQVMDKARLVRAKSFRIKSEDGSEPAQGDIVSQLSGDKKFYESDLEAPETQDDTSIMTALSDTVSKWF